MKKMFFAQSLFSILSVSALVALSGCTDNSSTNTAGVLTETESGKTIAGLVTNSDGQALPNVEVNLLTANHIAARMNPKFTTVTKDDGRFSLEKIPSGKYALQMRDSANTQSAYTTFDIPSDTENEKNNIMEISPSSLSENATLELDISTFSLAQGDTFCITGTLNCAVVDSSAISNGVLTLEGIPAAEFSNISLLQKGNEVSDQDISWNFRAGKTLHVSKIDSSRIVGEYSLTLPREAFDSVKVLEAPRTLNNIIVPVKLSKFIKNPSLLDDMGTIISLNKLAEEADSIRYLAMLPLADTTAYKLSILENDSAVTSKYIVKAYREMDTTMVIGEEGFWSGLLFQDNSMGVSFWIEADGKAVADTDAYLLNSTSNDIGFKISQCEPSSEELCTFIYIRVDSTLYDTVLTQKAKILDGKRHHYSFASVEKHMTIAVDGNIIRDTDVKISGNIFMLPGIATGKFKLDDLIIYSIAQNVRHNNDKEWERLRAWLHAFYYIAKYEDSSSR